MVRTGSWLEAALEKHRLIFIVEDDEPFREFHVKAHDGAGLHAEAFPSAADFLASPLLAETACLVADVRCLE